MHRLSCLTKQEKCIALRCAIKRKCPYGISGERLDCIMDNINIERPYCIKVTGNATKFLNIVTEECIATADKRTLSYTSKLYGEFTPGFFQKAKGNCSTILGTLDRSHNAAAIKISVTNRTDNQIGVTRTLVLYEAAMSICRN